MSSFLGKGSTPRPPSISKQEKDLRYELIFTKSDKRKKQIKKQLKDIENEKIN